MGKRLFDVVVAALALLVLAPVFAVVGVLIRIKLGTPVFFRQTRPGLDELPFALVKFRTMVDARDAEGELLPDAQRLTPLGRVLRSASLDELPQLWNVVRGDMSLVGPRPLLVDYLSYYTERERERHSVRPGMSGLAQISGRNRLPWDERLELDVQYVETCNLALDVAILLKSVQRAIQRRDVVELSANDEPLLSSYREGQVP